MVLLQALNHAVLYFFKTFRFDYQGFLSQIFLLINLVSNNFLFLDLHNVVSGCLYTYSGDLGKQVSCSQLITAGEAIAKPGDEKHAVRCCSQSGDTCSTLNEPCYEASTYYEAKDICEKKGLRLCSQTEMIGGVCCQTGCSFDCKYVWVEDLKGNVVLIFVNHNDTLNRAL